MPTGIGKLGIKKETTFKTAPSGNYGAHKVSSYDFKTTYNYVQNDEQFGNLVRYDEIQTTQTHSVSMSGYAHSSYVVGDLLRAITTNYTVTGSTAPFTHTFTLDNTLSLTPSYSIYIQQPGNTSAVSDWLFSGARMTSLKLSAQAGNYLMFSADWLAAKVANTGATIGGAETNNFFRPKITSATASFLNFDLTIKQGIENVYSLDNTLGATEAFTQDVTSFREVEVSATFYYDNNSFKTNYEQGTNTNFVITCNSMVAGGTLTITIPRLFIVNYEVDKGIKYTTAKISGRATFDGTALLTAVLVNANSGPY